MISSQNEQVVIHDLSDLTLQIIYDVRWAPRNIGSNHPIAWNNSRHGCSWQFHLHCGMEETGSPGISCILCHHVRHNPSEHGTSSMGKYLLAKAHITKLKNLTESEVNAWTSSTVDGSALAILKRQRSRGITIVSSQRRFIFDLPLNPYWSKWWTQCSKLATMDYDTYEFRQDTWNCYLLLRFVLARNAWNAISNLELQWSYTALRSDSVLHSAQPLATFPGVNMHWPWMQWWSNCCHEIQSV